MPEYSDSFEVIARAVIIQKGKILLCKGKGKGYFFFPGGHVEKGERTEEALRRELEEELGAEVQSAGYIGAAENIFTDSYAHHEINLVFAVEISASDLKSREGHIDFEMLDLADFDHMKVLPASLKGAVSGWLKDKKEFWRSE